MSDIHIVLLSKKSYEFPIAPTASIQIVQVQTERELHDISLKKDFDITVVEEGVSYQAISSELCVCLIQHNDMKHVQHLLSEGFDDVWTIESMHQSDFIARCYILMSHQELVAELEEERESTFNLIEALRTGKIERIPSNTASSGVIRLIDEKLIKENERLLKNIEKKTQLLEEIAHFDPLTDLPNRRQFNKALKREVARSDRHGDLMALLFVDLDKFKSINDTLGHDVGDLLLQDVALRMQSCIRDEDLVARIAGDEFAVILGDIKHTYNAGNVAQKIVEQLNTPFHCNENTLHISGSVGIACFPYAGEDAETLKKHADIAMYAAKEMGRNNYQYFTKELNGAHVQRLTMETDLRAALKNDELFLAYQPIVDVQSQELRGYEALVRWQRGDQVIYPTDFISIAEETGMILELGDWVIGQACRDLLDQNLPNELRISINVSCLQLTQNDLNTLLLKALDGYSERLQQIQLEITETAMMPNIEEIRPALDKLAEQGVTFAIDDFGTGFSSLSYLKQLPVSALKIDQSFVKDIVSNENDLLIVKSVIELAKNLQLSVVAEGVETKAQHEQLKQLGCQFGQGFYYGRPEPLK